MASTHLAAFPTRPYASYESASVFRNGKYLIRTLYSWELRMGNAPIVWDRLDNAGNLVTDLTGLTVEVEGNNITSTWAGTINNTSTEKTGAKKFTNSHQPAAMIPAWGFTFIFTGYEEGEGSPGLKIDLARPNEKIEVIKKDTVGINRVAKDANYLYGAATRIVYDGSSNKYRTGIVVLRQLPGGSNEYVELPGMVRVESGLEQPYYMLAQLDSPSIPDGTAWNQVEVISDLDVSDRYIYVAREGLDRIEVLDKANNHQLAATLSIAGPHRITLVGSTTLWVSSSTSNTVAEYALGEGTTATRTGRVLSGINEAADLDTSPNRTKLAVLDGNRLNDTRKLTTYAARVYDVASLEQVFTYGRAVSYGDDATIEDDKLLPINTKTFEQTPKINSTGFVAWQDDTHLWVGDCGNDDNKLVSITTRQIITRIGWRGFCYAAALIANDRWKKLQDYKQFELDPEIITTQGITATNGAYRATHNFALFRRAEYDDKYNRLAQPTKFDNGRTFAFLQHQRPADPTAPVDFHLLLVEKTATQVVYTDQKFPIGYCINKDQSLTYYESTDDNGNVLPDTGRVGALLTMWKRPKVGYNANGVPQFGPRQVAWGPIRVRLEDPITEGGGLVRNTRTDSGVYMTYSIDVTYNKPKGSRGGYYHTGILGEGEQELRGRFSPSTLRDWYEGKFPEDDKYEDANGTHYSGSYYQAVGDNLFTGANCEFYKGKAVFKWKAYNPLGLLRHVAGQTNQQGNPLPPGPPAYATNSTRGDFAPYKNFIVHVSGDEGAGAGSICMVYAGLDSIWSQSLPLSEYTPPTDSAVNLLAGLPKQSFVTSGTAGWTVSAASGLGLLLLTGRLETDGTDLLADFDGSLAAGNVRRALDVPAGPWEHRTVLRFTKGAFPQQAGELANVEYYDTSGRLIASTGRREITNDNCPLLLNNQVAGTRSTEAWRSYGDDRSVAIIGVGEDKRPYVEYAGFPRFYVDGPADPTADPHALGSVQLTFQNAGNRGYGIGLYQSRLTTQTIPPTPDPARMVATVPAPAPGPDQLLYATLSAAAQAHYDAGGQVLLRARLPRGMAGPWLLVGKSSGTQAATISSAAYECPAGGAQTIAVSGALWFGAVGIRTAGGKSISLDFGTGYTYAAGELTVLAAAGARAGDVVTYSYATGKVSGGTPPGGQLTPAQLAQVQAISSKVYIISDTGIKGYATLDAALVDAELLEDCAIVCNQKGLSSSGVTASAGVNTFYGQGLRFAPSQPIDFSGAIVFSYLSAGETRVGANSSQFHSSRLSRLAIDRQAVSLYNSVVQDVTGTGSLYLYGDTPDPRTVAAGITVIDRRSAAASTTRVYFSKWSNTTGQYLTSTTTNAGNGYQYYFVALPQKVSEILPAGTAGYDPATGTFTAPFDGIYDVNYYVAVVGLAAGDDYTALICNPGSTKPPISQQWFPVGAGIFNEGRLVEKLQLQAGQQIKLGIGATHAQAGQQFQFVATATVSLYKFL